MCPWIFGRSGFARTPALPPLSILESGEMLGFAHIPTGTHNQPFSRLPSTLSWILRGPSRDWGCDGGRVFPRSFSDRGWMCGLGFEAGGNRGGRRGGGGGRGGDQPE